MKLVIVYLIQFFRIILGSDDDEHNGNELKLTGSDKGAVSNCWMTLNAPHLFKVMDEIDARYAEVRNKVQEAITANDFDMSMVNGFIQTKGAAFRELKTHHHQPWMIPSGINLGGYCVLRVPDSVLFFHRMKLRNNTFFRVNGLHNDMTNMVVHINLALNDLHLRGAYERSLTDRDASILIYAPTYGEVEFLLKDVKYRMEGRYRLIKDRLRIELVSSEMVSDNVLMTYVNHALENTAIRVNSYGLGAFMERLKTDLDRWVKDYFNDYMIYAGLDGIPNIDELAKYDKEKSSALEEYLDYAIEAMGTRLRVYNAATLRVPSFTFKSIHGLEIKLYDGVIQGIDTMYRRSVPTGYKLRGNVRTVDAIIGFSNLKVVHKYEAVIPTGVPPLAGVLTLSANELSAHLALAIVNDPETIDLDIEFLDQLKPESLTIEGAANVMVSNFKHLLEHQIISMMTGSLLHGLYTLKNLPKCKPFIPGQIPKEFGSKSSDSSSDAVGPGSSSSNDNGALDISGEYKIALRSTDKPGDKYKLTGKPFNVEEEMKIIKSRAKKKRMY